MTGAFIFYTLSSVKNRLLSRARRLKQPRYMVAFIVGALYIWMAVGRGNWSDGFEYNAVPGGAIDAAIAVVSFIIGSLMILAWVLPDDQGGLDLNEAEIQFLFPAPLSRAKVIVFVLLKSLFPLIVIALLFAFVFFREASLFGVFATLAGLRVYFLLAKLGRARLKIAGLSFAVRAILVLLIYGVFVWIIAGAVLATGGLETALSEMDEEAIVQLSGVALEVFPSNLLLLIPSLYAKTAAYGLSAIGELSGLIAISIVFAFAAIRIDVSYEDATLVLARRKAESRGAKKARKAGHPIFERLPAPFPLRETGRPELAIVWKNAIAATRSSLPLFVLPLLVIVLLGILAELNGLPDTSGVDIVGGLLLGYAAILTLLGPAILRNDLRGDFNKFDLLRSFPLSAPTIVFAEIASPALIVIGMQVTIWAIGLLLVLVFSSFQDAYTALGLGISGALIAVPLTVLQIIIRNGLVIMLPGWTAVEEVKGIEGFGQQILLFLGQMFVLTVSLIPAVIVFVVTLVICNWAFSSSNAAAIAASVPAAMLLGVEAWFAIQYLGRKFEEIDVSVDLV